MEFKGKIEFYEKEIAFSIPENFDNFLKKISEMIDFKEEELLQKISLSYKDNEGDEVSLNSKDDYDAFIIYLKENDNILTTIILELKEFSEDLINKIHQKMKIHKEKVPEEKNFNINEFEFNNKINENIMDDYKINKDDFQDDILIVEDNDKNINEINQINDKYDYNENDFKNVNQFNNNFYNNDDINIIHSFQENNNNHNSISNNKSKYEKTCDFCNAYPLYDIFYYCDKCKNIYCSNCESKKGSLHPHPLYKIQTLEQYSNSDINKKDEKLTDKFVEMTSKIVGNLGNLVNATSKIFNRNKNDINEIENNNKRNNINNNENRKVDYKNDYKKIIEELKNDYDLSYINDEKIEEAVILANGNKDKALGLLFP